jgi:putative addiction module antidote
MFTMQKVFVNGNSLAITLPKLIAEQLGLKSGSPIEWKSTPEGAMLSTAKHAKSPSEIDPEVNKLIKTLSKKYAGVWQELAKL